MVKKYFRHILLSTLFLLLSGLCLFPAFAQESLDRYRVAFILNFVKYIENSSGNNSICIINAPEIYGILKSKPNVKHFDSVLSDISACALVYLSKDENDKIATLISATSGQQVITVSDSVGFAAKGGIVELFEDSGKLKFTLNIKKANALKLKVNSKLVEIADKTI